MYYLDVKILLVEEEVMLMRPFDSHATNILVAARIEALRGGRPLPRKSRGPRTN